MCTVPARRWQRRLANKERRTTNHEGAARGPTAYVLGHNYLRLKRPDDTAKLFQTAVTDAPPAKAVLAGQGATTSKGMAGNTPRGLRR